MRHAKFEDTVGKKMPVEGVHRLVERSKYEITQVRESVLSTTFWCAGGLHLSEWVDAVLKMHFALALLCSVLA